jgi:hypothetical protein
MLYWVQNGLEKKVEKSRKQKKERRNRARKVRGAKKNSCECCLNQHFINQRFTARGCSLGRKLSQQSGVTATWPPCYLLMGRVLNLSNVCRCLCLSITLMMVLCFHVCARSCWWQEVNRPIERAAGYGACHQGDCVRALSHVSHESVQPD